MIKIPTRKQEIYITESEWIDLNNKYTQTEIIKAISDTMGRLNFPLKPITEQDALKDFQDLKNLDETSLIKQGSLFTKRNYKWGMSDVYVDMSIIGNTSSNYYHQEARFKCDSLNSPSPYRVWNTEKFRLNMLKNLWTMPTTVVDSNRLRQAMALRNYVASQFKPSAAKALYTHFKSKHILDFCSGWGDRLAGFSSNHNTKRYTGVDPNILLLPNYVKQFKTYKPNNKSVNFIQDCAEQVIYEEKFDTVFTSPPYFDIERYSQDSTQSWKRYKGDTTVEEKTATSPRIARPDPWLEGFLYPAIKNAWDALESGGIIAINIADVYGHHAWQLICDPMNDFIETLPRSEYQGGIGYRMAKRPNSLVDEYKIEGQTEKPAIGKIYVEPIWVWKKL